MVDALIQTLQPSVLLYMMIGVVLGIFIGALPGLTATMGVAILIPLTFWLQPQEGLAMLIAIYCSSIFAGGIPAILLNAPGTPASMTTAWDGYELNKQGKTGLALGVNAIYSALGGIISTVFLLVAAFPISRVALSFGPPEYFALAIFGLSMMISVSGKSISKGLIMGFAGLFIATIGLDPMLSMPRFTFGSTSLLDGISFIPIMIGLFGLGEVLSQILDSDKEEKVKPKKIGRILPNKQERKLMRKPFWLSSMISTITGAIPGAGGDIASMISWEQSKRFSKNKEKFGKGSLEGLSASSTANNAVIGGAFTTMLTLGLPGDSVTAILIGALMVYGMQPGPTLFTDHVDFVYIIICLLFLANILVLFIGVFGANIFSRIMLVKREIIWASVILFSIVGAYALNNSLFDVWVMAISGVIGVVLRKLDFPLGPLILALILGPMAESNLRRSLSMSLDGSLTYFLTRPITMTLLTIAVLSLIFPLIKGLYFKSKNNKKPVDF
ncbi:tripartite tricarboxylate transporter permease [Alkalihalophilus marmarensis]|jgi:putative tricarboxylic transport membrane protein|uniref:tripartite tricarboxylate transporter permease n=1 Tax=Alkalihalophilus marmarensis TaxID=521377 RepID=UPI00203ED98D|nr:tripartite tricarboxylate transporter permease [Alkalihalophilus marmarensis]MCM3489878.1 tripartite tricarboxylate transporter permease [Alkalihalophilus marmarensis]